MFRAYAFLEKTDKAVVICHEDTYYILLENVSFSVLYFLQMIEVNKAMVLTQTVQFHDRMFHIKKYDYFIMDNFKFYNMVLQVIQRKTLTVNY